MPDEAILPGRVTSVDALRGLTIAFMILVNDPGDWEHIYWPLDHAQWSGWTPTDLVFPSFVFLVGCSVVFSVNARLRRGASRTAISLQILRRAATLFLIKMAISAYPHFHMTHLRILGVLTRIALCYLFAGLLYVWVRRPVWIAAIIAALLLGYWVLMRWTPIPGIGMPVRDVPLLDPDRNLAAWMDRGFNVWCRAWLHTGRLYEKTRDPEGLLSTMPAIGTALLGVLAGLWVSSDAAKAAKRNGLLIAGVVSFALGEVWSIWFPINKKLWTSSYVLLTGGISLLLLGLAYWLLDAERVQQRSRAVRALVWPMLVFGSNAIAAFCLSEILDETLGWWKVVHNDDGTVSAWAWLYEHSFAWNGSTELSSLCFAIAYVVVCFLPIWWLWRRKIFLKV